jgi:ribonuclease T2
LSISAALAAVVVASVTYSVLVLDRDPDTSTVVSQTSDSSWLVVTWGPSLCAVDPTNMGCASGHVGSMGRTFVLHGLWPQPPERQYCGVPKPIEDRARDIHGSGVPPVDLADDVRKEVEPLLSDAAVMAPHEWYAHGTCSGVTADEYFGDAADLATQARAMLDPLFAAAPGGRITLTAIRDRFDKQFGDGAGQRVGLSCRKKTGEQPVVYEVQMSLPSVAALNTGNTALSLGQLLEKGPPITAQCRHGSVP